MTTPLTGAFPIAIVGIGCRFPDAPGPAPFWNLLANGRDAIREIPRDRFDVDRLYDPEAATPGRVNTRWGGFLESIDRFDIDFFDMSPREAERLDPQQRLLLETSWEALEDAGVVPGDTAGSQSGVFVGMWTNDYEARLFRDLSGVDFYMTTGTGRYAASGRVSYALGWQGPSVTVDTGCSSSLVAVHLACQSLWTGETGLALAAGVNIILEPHVTVAYSQSRMMAPDGRCKFGDARADGYVRSEGAGVVVLKPLAAARRDGDRIYATILGTAVTNDGRSSGFLTTPGSEGQTEMLRLAYQRAGVSPGAVTYVEAHGTGTRAGDPVEIGALAQVLGAGRSADHPCRIGSVKTNIGHTEAAAGIAGVIKVALSLRHRAWPASLHCDEKNPAIPWATMPLVLQQVHEAWRSNGAAVVAGVNSFGISGTNAHAVLREHVETAIDEARPASARPCVLLLSGHTEAALDARLAQFRGWLNGVEPSGSALRDLCWTAARRTHHSHRATLAARDLPHLREQLEGLMRGEAGPGVVRGRRQADRRNRAVFVFPGQGSQWYGMGRQLFEHEAAFRTELEACDRAVATLTGWSVIDRLGADESSAALSEIDCIQPVLFSIQVALAALWRSWGVEPAAVVGHSMGEVAAAHVAGALSIEAAARIICRRSALLRQTSGRGAMAVVDLAFAEAQAAIGERRDRVSVAASNSPRTTVLSGDPGALDALIAELEGQDVFCRRVKVDVASHSPQMDPLRDDLLRALIGLTPTAGVIPIYSTVTGRVSDGSDFDADYWVRNLRQPVLFAGAVEALAATGHDTFIEISPHPILTPAIEEGLRATSLPATLVVPSLRRDEDEQLVLLGSLGTLHVGGYPTEWRRMHTEPGQVVDLPPYPWQRERFWVDTASALDLSGPTGSPGDAGRRAHPLLGARREMSDRPGTSVWDLEVSDRSVRYLTGHHVDPRRLVPSSVCLELALAAVFDVYGASSYSLEDVEFRQPISVPIGAAAVSLQLVLSPEASALCAFRLSSRGSAGWTLHVSGRVDRTSIPIASSRDAWRLPATGGTAEEERAGFYARLAAMGLEVAPCLRTLAGRALVDGLQVAAIELPATATGELARYHAHPAALDAALQLVAAAGGHEGESFAAPVRIARASFWSPVDRLMRAGLRASTPDARQHSDPAFDLVLCDESGDAACELLGIEVQQHGRGSGSSSLHVADWLYDLQWQPVTLPRAAVPSAVRSGPGRWLILADQGGVGAAISASLAEEHGASAVLVQAGADYVKQDVALYVARAGERRDLEAILVDAFPDQAECAGVVDLRSLNVAHPDATTAAPLSGADTHAAHSAVALVQAIGAHAWHRPPRVWFVSSGAQAVRGEGRIAAGQAMVWGIGRAVREEHPEHWGGLIDVDPQQPVASAAIVAGWLVSVHGEDQLAIRGGDSYALRLARLELEAASPRALRVRADGSYLIAGGLGDLGLQVARWLCEQGAKRLVLLGRAALPPREEWRRIDPASSRAGQIAAIKALEAQGVSVRTEAVDVADGPALLQLLERLRHDDWPPLRGVVHCAGVLEGRLLQHLDHELLDSGLRAKVAGSWNLHATTLAEPLDFFVLCSSIAAYLPSPGQAAYSAANAFQDALAADRRALGLPSLTINWGPWSIGLAVAPAERGASLTSRGVESLAAAHGLAAFSTLIGSDRSQASVIRFSWRRWQAGCGAGEPPAFFSVLAREDAAIPQAAAGDDGGNLRQQLAALEDEARAVRLEAFLQVQVAQVLKRAPDRIDVERPFRAMGLDSLMALELRNRLEAALALRLPATMAWNYPTVKLLATQLSMRVSAEVASPPPAAAAAEHGMPVVSVPTTEQAEIERLLDEIEQLSDDEARRLMSAVSPTSEHANG